MPVSTHYKIAFIHIPKNAGKSIENALRIVSVKSQQHAHQMTNLVAKGCYFLGALFDHYLLRRKGFGTTKISINLTHLTFMEMQYALNITNQYTWLACIRNPYTRMNALYLHHREKLSLKEEFESIQDFIGRFFNLNNATFSSDQIAHRRLQIHFIEGLDGRLHPNIELIEFEELEDQFKSFCRRHHFFPRLSWHEKQAGTPAGLSNNFSSWNSRELELVNHYYQRDFLELGYPILTLKALKKISHGQHNLLKRCSNSKSS